MFQLERGADSFWKSFAIAELPFGASERFQRPHSILWYVTVTAAMLKLGLAYAREVSFPWKNCLQCLLALSLACFRLLLIVGAIVPLLGDLNFKKRIHSVCT